MNTNDLTEKNPLRALYRQDGGGPRMGLVKARAGLGKTAILVQIALDSLMCGRQVLHVSIGQSLDKTRTWYDDIFKDIVATMQVSSTLELANQINRNRLIMTFKESSFSRPKLEERLNDLLYQNIFRPSCMIIDGYDFQNCDLQMIADIRELAQAMEMETWFSATIHRDDPSPCPGVEDLFDTIIALEPRSDDKCIALNVVKDTTANATAGKVLNLDPSTLMLKEAYDKC
ncbi:MAG: DEAD/DEAH box helicase family protein [Thermodesulfobacteriota bacterium]